MHVWYHIWFFYCHLLNYLFDICIWFHYNVNKIIFITLFGSVEKMRNSNSINNVNEKFNHTDMLIFSIKKKSLIKLYQTVRARLWQMQKPLEVVFNSNLSKFSNCLALYVIQNSEICIRNIVALMISN